MPDAHIPIVGTRKPDSDVGTSGDPAVAGGGQSPDQAAITRQGQGGQTDATRNAQWDGTESDRAAKGRNPAPAGGSSDGQSDRPRSPATGSEE